MTPAPTDSSSTDQALDRVFRALADPTRRRIIDRLRDRPDQSLFEICAAASAQGTPVLTRQAVSQHLDMLERAGLIAVTWSGRTKLHRLNPEPMRLAVSLWLGDHIEIGPRRPRKGP